MESTTNRTPIYPDCERTGMNSLGLATVYIAPKSNPHPRQKPSHPRPHRGGTPLFWLMGPTVPSYILFCASD